jgi:Tat protein translocase TatB subunit
MFGIGMPELMLIFVLALLVFGPKELPKIARTLGKAMAELRRASDELRDGIQREIELAEREEAPSSPPEAVPSTTLAEGASPALETPPGPTPADAPAEGTGTPPGTVAAEVPTESITPAPGEQVGETPDKGMVEPTVTSPPPETSEAKEGSGAPAEHQPKPETLPGAPAHPVETRNA